MHRMCCVLTRVLVTLFLCARTHEFAHRLATLFELNLKQQDKVVQRLHVQCCSLSCNLHTRDLFLSSSWDDTVKLWSLGQPTALRTFTGHTYCVYHVAWCVWESLDVDSWESKAAGLCIGADEFSAQPLQASHDLYSMDGSCWK